MYHVAENISIIYYGPFQPKVPWYLHFLCIMVLHLWIQPTVIKNIPEKKNSRKFQKVKSKFATVATIYIAFTLY